MHKHKKPQRGFFDDALPCARRTGALLSMADYRPIEGVRTPSAGKYSSVTTTRLGAQPKLRQTLQHGFPDGSTTSLKLVSRLQ